MHNISIAIVIIIVSYIYEHLRQTTTQKNYRAGHGKLETIQQLSPKLCNQTCGASNYYDFACVFPLGVMLL